VRQVAGDEIGARASRLARRRDRPGAVGHHRLDGPLLGLGELLAGAREHLDAVVAVGIVRGRDDDAEVKTLGLGQVGDGRGRHDADAVGLGTLARQPVRQGRLDPWARLTGIASDEHPQAGAAVHAHEGGTDPRNRAGVERDRARLAANAIGAEQRHGVRHSPPRLIAAPAVRSAAPCVA
jgi:hypothetical protein